jgi:hypothetical protein
MNVEDEASADKEEKKERRVKIEEPKKESSERRVKTPEYKVVSK